MSDQGKSLEIEDERVAEKQYGKVLQEKATSLLGTDGPASGSWTGTGVPKKRRVAEGRFWGRVALIRGDDMLDGKAEFYIGEEYAVVDGVNVFGWSNPIACTFFRGPDHHDLCDEVAVVRAFRHDTGHIVDFVDETMRPDAPAAPFRKRGLSIPAPPTAPRRPSPISQPEPPATPMPAPSPGPNLDQPRPADPTGDKPAKKAPADDLPKVRAESLLREQLLAPRTKSLTPVLSTLQPDQYELVSMPAMESVVIQGQPGTGKTIVASHRAAYLVNDETPPENALDGTVLVVGPTDGYSRHVREVINRLAGDNQRIRVLSLPELADEIIGSSKSPHTGVSRTYQDVGWELVRFVRSAIAKLKASTGAKPRPSDVYEFIRTRPEQFNAERDWSGYLGRLPLYKDALALRVHAPLIAFIHWEVSKPTDLAHVEHIIVDEAQDVTPLEWYLLDEINEADAWTILGDLNQRRSDHTLSSWDQVLEVIAIDPGTPIRQMKRGYRSTKPILDFANRLLPRNQRKTYAFQESGPEPTVTRVSGREIGECAVREIKRLIAAYPAGTVAAICRSPATITLELRAEGWANDASKPEVWTRGSQHVSVMVTDLARGLEFDGVVVVEPSDFPQNFGRHGPLYTALTRANRELAVVHADGLPEPLRRR
jgi:DNA helicase-2/ATP-dependent DNA helicase PcrA